MLLLTLLALADSAAPRLIVTAPAETVAVHVVGVGRPVVFVPGLFGAAFEFRMGVPDLIAEGRQVIIIEMLGTGQSGRPRKADYSLTAQARRVAAVLDTLGIQRAIVVAHSVAGSVAMRLAVERPDLVGGLVSIEGGAAESATSPGLRDALDWAPLLVETVTVRAPSRRAERITNAPAAVSVVTVSDELSRIGGKRQPQGRRRVNQPERNAYLDCERSPAAPAYISD